MGYRHICVHCNKQIPENKSKGQYARSAGQPIIWGRLQHYIKSHGGNYNKEDYFCQKFLTALLNHAIATGFETGRSANKLGIFNPSTSNIVPSTLRSGKRTRTPSASPPPAESNSPKTISRQTRSATKRIAVERAKSPHHGTSRDGRANKTEEELPSTEDPQQQEKTTEDNESQLGPRDVEQAADLQYEESGLAQVRLDERQSEEPIQAEAVYSQSTNGTQRYSKSGKVKLDKLFAVPSTQARCLVCKKTEALSRKTFPESARIDLWLRDNVIIPIKCRCCLSHIKNGIFDEDAKIKIRNAKRRGMYATAEDVQYLISNLTELLGKKKKVLDFDAPDLEDDVYKEMTGLSKNDFEELLEYIHCHMNESKNRSKRNALAIFLVKLRLGISQRVIARLFGVSQSVVSATFNKVRELLMKHFVPLNIGYDHMSRSEILKSHNPEYVRKLFDVQGNNLALLADGTYVFIQQSKDHKLQSETWSPHKHRNLVKYMMVVTPDGHIISAPGPWKSDGKHGDSNILNKMGEKEEFDGLRKFLIEGDHIIGDRGFQRANLQSGVKCSIPPNLNGRACFEPEEANLSRKITLVRWVVEAVNGRIKNMFDFFNNVVPNTYLPVIGDLFQIVCGIINRFCPPLFQESAKHQAILRTVDERIDLTNRLKDEIEERELKKRAPFKKGHSDDVQDFPRLNEDDLFSLTLGIYQIKNAASYTVNHLNKDNLYELLLHKEDSSLIRAQLKSRFRRSIKHNLWIEFDNELEGSEAITGYYCECQIGSRVIGMCSHITAVIWYLSYARHQASMPKKKDYTKFLLDVAETKSRVENPGLNAEDEDANADENGVPLFLPNEESDSPPGLLTVS